MHVYFFREQTKTRLFILVLYKTLTTTDLCMHICVVVLKEGRVERNKNEGKSGGSKKEGGRAVREGGT